MLFGIIQPWGFFVASGVIIGLLLGLKRAPRLGLDPDQFSALATWILIGGFLGARLMHVTAYAWDDYKDNLFEIIKLWEGGMSSYGGFIGATVGGIAFIKKSGINFLRYADLTSFAFVPAWAVGRIGCFAIHDHPGRLSDFFLAAEMWAEPVGVAGRVLQARHDLGLYDGILAAAMTAFFVWGNTKRRFDGFYLGWMCVLYSVPRFFLDSLRATDLYGSDARYAGLTPAQYGSILLLAIGGWILWSRRDKPPVPLSP